MTIAVDMGRKATKTKQNNSTKVRFHLSYDIKVTLKSYFSSKKRYNFVIMYTTLLWTS